MSSRLQTARYEQFLRRLLRIVEGGVLPVLQGDISPVLSLEDPVDPALLFWKGHNLAWGQVVAPAVVGANSTIFISNPSDSERLVVVQTVSFKPSAGSDIGVQYQPGTVGQAAGPTKQMRDSRHPDTAEPVATTNLGSSGVVNANYLFYQPTAGDVFKLNVVLSPGNLLVFTQDAINAAFEASLTWLERKVESPELATS